MKRREDREAHEVFLKSIMGDRADEKAAWRKESSGDQAKWVQKTQLRRD